MPIPTRQFPYPNIPNHMLLIKTTIPINNSTFTDQYFSDHFYYNYAPTPFTFFPAGLTQYIRDHWLMPSYRLIVPHDTAAFGAWVFWKNLPYMFSSPITSTSYVNLNSDRLDYAISACITIKTADGHREGVGRCYPAQVPANFVTENRWNLAGGLAYQLALNVFANPIVFGGNTFTRVVWSRAANLINPVTEMRLLPQPAVLRRRRLRLPYTKGQILFPNRPFG